MPNRDIENALYGEGFGFVCGVDEAGRGPLAGPVYAAAVMFTRGVEIDGLDDSKKLTPEKREQLYDIITARAAAYCVASASVAEIAELNILGATHLAMSRAIAGLSPPPDIALIDGNNARGVAFPHRCVVGGDEKSYSIAAASVLAKVSRDRYMLELAARYPGYGFERHMGYGTKAHYAAIDALGETPEHRALFLRKYYERKNR